MAPPRPRGCLNVGVTGHRLNRLSTADVAAAGPALAQLLRAIAHATTQILAEEHAWFADAPPEFRLLSGLAEGSDRLVAALALREGYALHALLPFARDTYAADFESDRSQAEYRGLLAAAERIFELPGERALPERAYEMTGRAIVAHADVIVALWDGTPAHGRGGTATVVESALAHGIPVIHLRPGAGAAPAILWSGFEEFPAGHDGADDYRPVPCDDGALRSVIARLLLPAEHAGERACLAQYYAETERRHRARIEYPLLLALAGVRRMGLGTFRAQPYAEATARDWAGFHVRMQKLGLRDHAGIGELQDAYAWCDNLANHFAQTFRSGHVLNFVLTATAVLLALSGLLWPAVKFWLIVAELATISLLVVNTQVGRARQWHRRWLDYRYLAECLRPMRSLKLYGVVGSAGRRPGQSGAPLRWPDWYAESVWRQIGCPAGDVDGRYREALNALVVAAELQPQIDYHRVTAHRMHTLEHRLHRVGNLLFSVTIAACLVFLGGYFVAHDWTVARALVFTAITAALPALGGAIYGIRVQGDFGGAASRSLKAAADLHRLSAALAATPAPSHTQAAALCEEAARTMLSDLVEWQVTYRQRGLAIPA